MNGFFVPLQLTNGITGVYVGTLTGTDEMLVTDVSTRTGLLLLERIIQPENGNVADIVTADRDRIFAALFMKLYGTKIESTILCRHCGEQFDLDFSLQSLLQHYQLTPAVSNEGVFEIEPAIRFRLPTGADELLLNEVAGTAATNLLLSRCVIAGDIEKVGDLVQEKMAEIAPVLNLAMKAHCPECDTGQEVHFDIQTFFLTKLKHEQSQLIKEIHRIAKTYHWSSEAILNLPRPLRKQYVAMIESEF